MKITLPAEPIDLYEIKWWEINGEKLYECRAVYHVHRAWVEIYPEDVHRPGADFHDEWQCFENGWPKGRVDGWNLLERPSWQDTFKFAFTTTGAESTSSWRSREVAILEIRRQLQKRVKRLREEIAEYERRLDSGDFR